MINFGALTGPEPEPTSTQLPFRTAVVTNRTPLRIRLESDAQPLPITPVSLVPPADLIVGDRVMVMWQITPGRASGIVVIFGKVNDKSQLERKASGTVTVRVNASAGGTAAVAFPAGRFMAADVLNVQLTKVGSGLPKYIPYATAISATGMTVGVHSGDGTTTTASVVIHWRVEVAS